ncbi:hypothetical protein [Erythrobacter sp. Alg231-14]|uniref:hypothetical protein n=1 Tax=Erythrobacter sp. Alg231-14 TaxID=1922225 RepID=UPI000D55DC43
MTQSDGPNGPLAAWRNLASEAQFAAPDTCKAQADRFSLYVHIRNAIEYGSGALGLLLFIGLTVAASMKDEWLIALSGVVVIVGIVVLLWGLYRRGSSLARMPEDDCVTHLRKQYERQFIALRSVPLWYIGPLVPGLYLLLFAITYQVAQDVGWTRAIDGISWSVAALTVMIAAIAGVNWMGARAILRKIKALDALA